MPGAGTSPSGEVGRAASGTWGGPFVLGLIVAIIGCLAIIGATLTGFLSIFLVGIALFVSGVFELVRAIRDWGSRWSLAYLLGGILSVVVGLLFAFRTTVGLAAVTFLLAGYFLGNGLFRGITSIADRYPHWGLDFGYGVISVLLGIVVVAGWPMSSLRIIGMLVGIEILAHGISLMAAGLVTRRSLRAAAATSG
jgi:uncharacterized membrane protein HdeD (DUF308 family)